MKYFLPLVIIFVLLIEACEPLEEKISNQSDLQLRFSEDTVLFDTLISDTLSLTKRFRIINPNSNAVEVSSIRLAGGASSEYSIIVNGKEGPVVNNQVIFGGDSILVLVDVDIDPEDEDLPYLVKDSVIVEWNQNSENVKLIAWGQDAHFIKSREICDTLWTADRPYVIQNAVIVDENCTLTIEAGAKIYLDNGATFIVEGTIKAVGDSANRITFRNTRFDENYLEAPGQWSGIVFMETSTENVLSYCDIENGQIGVGLGYAYGQLSDGSTILIPENSSLQTSITIDHTSIRHMSTAGILAFSADVYAYNLEVYNVAAFLVGGFAGGNYRYEHCTFSNLGSFFINDDPMSQFSDNLQLTEEENITGDLNLVIKNSILWGQGPEQLLISDAEGVATVETLFESNIIKSEEEIENNYTSQDDEFPGFVDPFIFDFQLDSLAFARDKGIDLQIETDLLGITRDSLPDIGAYERIDPE